MGVPSVRFARQSADTQTMTGAQRLTPAVSKNRKWSTCGADEGAIELQSLDLSSHTHNVGRGR